jgi:hypothetical protein
MEHGLFGRPVFTPDKIRGGLFPNRAQAHPDIYESPATTGLTQDEIPGAEIFRSVAQATFLTGGGVQVALRMDGVFWLGQYIRSIRTNFPAGAGSQFDSLSAPGD